MVREFARAARLDPGRVRRYFARVAAVAAPFNASREEPTMAASIPENFQDLVTSKITFAHLGTVMKNGTPQVTPIWFSFDGKQILLNSAKGRVKDKNMRARPHVALSILDPDNAYRYIQIIGEITEITEQGGDDHIERVCTPKHV